MGTNEKRDTMVTLSRCCHCTGTVRQHSKNKQRHFLEAEVNIGCDLLSSIAAVDDMENPSKLLANGPGGILMPFDDGHIPENLPSEKYPTKLVDYPFLFDDQQHHDDTDKSEEEEEHIRPTGAVRVNIFENAIPEPIVDGAYQKTVDESYPSWGDYVTISQIQKYWKKQEEKDEETTTGKDDADLMIQLAAHYLELTMNSKPTRQITNIAPTTGQNGEIQEMVINKQEYKDQSMKKSLLSKGDISKLHGIALWGLRAKIGSKVAYHLDYAEQIRYEHNVIVPPLLAGTLQCTRNQLVGGDFCISLDGISHYEKHGYKTKRKPIDMENMIRIPYRYNQLTCHYGNLPHASTKIQEIHGEQQRVIVGFNAFGHDFGPLVAEAPEHSDAFRRKIQSQRALNKTLSLQQIKQNKGLTKLLVLAKRERIKNEYNQAKQKLQQDLPSRLPATVQELMTLYSHLNQGQENSCWPSSSVDVQVFLHHQIEDGHFQITNAESLPPQVSKTDLISPMALIDLPSN